MKIWKNFENSWLEREICWQKKLISQIGIFFCPIIAFLALPLIGWLPVGEVLQERIFFFWLGWMSFATIFCALCAVYFDLKIEKIDKSRQ